MKPQTSTIGDHTCPWWLIFTFDNPFRKLIHNPKIILSGFVNPGDTVLDVGCGMGYFSMGLAELVGKNGLVIAADLQEKMLTGLQKRARRAELQSRIQTHLSTPEQIGVDSPIDFVLAFWMVHEVCGQENFLQEIYNLLKPGGKFLIVEPKIHVIKAAFQRTIQTSDSIGFSVENYPKVIASRAVILTK